MILIDDHLTLLLLAGGLERAEFDEQDVATTSLWYLRLVAAVTAPPTPGKGAGRLRRVLDNLSPAEEQAAMARILEPDPTLVEVLHPRRFAADTARMQRDHRLNLLAAETLGAAVHYGATIVVAAPNAGGPIERAASQTNVVYRVRSS